MTRVINFADGFTSASAPTVEGGVQQDYTILNNQASNVTLFTLDASQTTTAFYLFELSRGTYSQSGTFILSYNGSSWIYNLGNWQGDDMIVSTLANGQDVRFEITTSSGVGSFKYTSGNDASGELKVYETKVLV